jgi:uncharacterized protein (DUF697 family)
VSRLTRAAIDRLADRLAGATDAAVALAIDRRGPAIARAADGLRAAHPGSSAHRLARMAVTDRSRHVAATGAVSALPAILPGPGTATEIAAALGDISFLTYAQVELVLMLAHLYGRPLDDHEARRLDVLMAMGVEAGIVRLRRDGSVDVAGERYPADALRGAAEDRLAQRVNRRLGAQVVGRLARRRAHIILGREIPVLGIGLAAAYNAWSTRKVGHAAADYFEHLV